MLLDRTPIEHAKRLDLPPRPRATVNFAATDQLQVFILRTLYTSRGRACYFDGDYVQEARGRCTPGPGNPSPSLWVISGADEKV